MKYSFNLIYMEKDRCLQESETNFIRMFGVGEGRDDRKRKGREETGESVLVGREASNNCPMCEALRKREKRGF